MTLDEKLLYVGGDRDFYIRAIPRLGIPAMKMSDGPGGCRNYGPSTAYPAPIALAASFNTALADRVGRSIARDCRARDVQILLGPGVNIQRSPLAGRNFEYLGEDPVLAGEMATHYVRGVQAEGVLATVKHFALNNQEWDRNHISSDAPERVLREIYLPAFEKVVREGRVGAVMTAYNLVNGIYASHHPWLLGTVLRQDWGFQGMVMSDWGAVHDPLGGALGGTDLEMPRAEQMSPEHLRGFLDSKTISTELIDEKVFHILRPLIAAGLLDPKKEMVPPKDNPASFAAALEAAEQSIVLLKNERSTLPLQAPKLKKVVVIGPTAHPAVHGGSGSAYVDPLHPVSVWEGLKQALSGAEVTFHPGLQRETSLGALGQKQFLTGLKMEVFLGKKPGKDPVFSTNVDAINYRPAPGQGPAPGIRGEDYSLRFTGTITAPKSANYEILARSDDGIVVFIDGQKVLDDWSIHAPRLVSDSRYLTRGKHSLSVEYFQGTAGALAQFGLAESGEGVELGRATLQTALQHADAAIVCVGYGQSKNTNSFAHEFQPFWPSGEVRAANLVETEDSDRSFELPRPQLETLSLVRQHTKSMIALVMAGGGVDMMPWASEVDALLWAFYPGEAGGTALSELLLGQKNPSAKLPMTLAKQYADHPAARYYSENDRGHSPYGEGLEVGYRGFDAHGIEPLFPFGFGLSYTSFEYKDVAVRTVDAGKVELHFTLANTGSLRGAEVVQIYVAPPTASRTTHARPPQKLEAFTRVELEPGESREVTIELGPRAFAYWDHGFVIDAGAHEILVSASSRDVRLRTSVAQAARRL